MGYVFRNTCLTLIAILLAGCNGQFSGGAKPAPHKVSGPAAQPDSLQTTPAPKPARTARTAEQFDTTTEAQRAAAVQRAPSQGERRLGKTIGSLGNPADPGLWIKTPLVSKPSKGRIEYPANGKSVAVDLIPIEGEETAGSRVSLAAMRLLEVPLTGLTQLIVMQNK